MFSCSISWYTKNGGSAPRLILEILKVVFICSFEAEEQAQDRTYDPVELRAKSTRNPDDARDLTVSRLQEYWDTMGMDITDING